MYKVYWFNFDNFAIDSFDTVTEAINYGKSKGFEFAVYDDTNNTIATWSPISGLKKY